MQGLTSSEVDEHRGMTVDLHDMETSDTLMETSFTSAHIQLALPSVPISELNFRRIKLGWLKIPGIMT